MNRIFPEAQDYKSVTVPISREQREKIEALLGSTLLPGQQDRFQYYEMTGDQGRVIGTLIASSQKGEFGAVEFVVGLDPTGTIRDIYIQRARERNPFFKSREFLDRFRGISIEESAGFRALDADNSTPGTQAVIQGLIKEGICYIELTRQPGNYLQ